MFRRIVKVLAVITLLCVSAEGIDHCQINQFHKSKNSTNMQLTKEPVNQEYAVIGAFKSLHCCAKGYRSIEWYVDRIIKILFMEITSFAVRLFENQ